MTRKNQGKSTSRSQTNEAQASAAGATGTAPSASSAAASSAVPGKSLIDNLVHVQEYVKQVYTLISTRDSAGLERLGFDTTRCVLVAR